MKKNKERIIYLFSSVGITALFVFGIVNMIQGNIIAGVVELAAAGITTINLLLVRFFRMTELGASVILALMLVVLSFLIVNGGVSGSGILWFYTFPPLVLYLKPFRVGMVWTALLALSVVLMYLSGNSFYERSELIQLAASFTAVMLMVYFYVLANKESGTVIVQQNETLTALNNELQEKLSSQEEFDAIIRTKNKELEDTKKATLNLLEDLQQEKSQDEAILASISDGLTVTDEKGVIILANDACVDLLGWTREELIGQKLTDLVPMFDEEGNPINENNRPLIKVLNQDPTFELASLYYYGQKNGNKVPVSVSIAPIPSGEKITGTVEVFRDVTHEQAVDKAKTEFVSLASHQLRTPLSAIKWYVELLLSGDFGKLTKNQEEYVNEIPKGSERMIELVGSLLDVSRLELGTITTEPEELNLSLIIDDIVKEHKPTIVEKELVFKTDIERNGPTICADKKLTRIALENLISNAVKYTPQKGSVEVKLALEKSSQATYAYTVQDSGIGIPKDQQDKVFQKLFRADNAREGDTTGTGLGLYLVKLILEKMGGSIMFTSDSGKGTLFTVRIPVTS